MTPRIRITRTILEDAQGSAYLTYEETVQSLSGDAVLIGNVTLPLFGDTPLAKPDWTNADREAALAAHLGVAPSDITTAVYTPPEPPAVPPNA